MIAVSDTEAARIVDLLLSEQGEAIRQYLKVQLIAGTIMVEDACEYRLLWGEWPRGYVAICRKFYPDQDLS